MSISLFSAAIFLIFITIAAIEIHRGMERGFFKTLLSLGTLSLSIVLSLTIAPYLSNGLIMGFFDIIPDLISMLEGVETLLSSLLNSTGASTTVSFEMLILSLESIDINADPNIAYYLAIVCALISTLLSIILLFPLRSILNSSVRIISRRMLTATSNAPEYHQGSNSFFHRNTVLLGGITGGIIAILISMMITAPIMGTLDLFVTVGDHLLETEPQFMSQLGIGNDGFEVLKTCSKDIPGNLLYQFGGKYMYLAAARGQIGEKMVYLYSLPEVVESTLLLLTTSYTMNVMILVQPIIDSIFQAVILICSPILYVFLTARLLPKFLLIPSASALHIKDRGVKRQLFSQGRAIVCQPAVDMRAYIPQYILSDNDGQRFLKCKLDDRIKAIRYRVLPFDVNDRPLTILEVEEPILHPGTASAVSLPLNTAYVSLCVQEVNGVKLPSDGNVGFCRTKVLAYGLSTLLLTVVEAFALKQALASFASLIFAYCGTASADFGKILLPAILLGAVYAGFVFYLQYTRDRKFVR